MLQQGVGVIIRNGESGLLVRAAEAAATWTIPGGHVEPGELLHEAAAREVSEETGLSIEQLALAAVTQYDVPPSQNPWSVFIFEAAWAKDGTLLEEPDSEIAERAWVRLDVAIERLQALPRPQSEPIVAYLSGRARTGAVWCYRRADGSSYDLRHSST